MKTPLVCSLLPSSSSSFFWYVFSLLGFFTPSLTFSQFMSHRMMLLWLLLRLDVNSSKYSSSVMWNFVTGTRRVQTCGQTLSRERTSSDLRVKVIQVLLQIWKIMSSSVVWEYCMLTSLNIKGLHHTANFSNFNLCFMEMLLKKLINLCNIYLLWGCFEMRSKFRKALLCMHYLEP